VITPSQQQEWYYNILNDVEEYYFYIIWEKDKRIGTISARVGEVIEIGNVLIDKQYRKMGYCREAIRELLELHPGKDAFVEIFPNDKITSIYKSIGFIERKWTLWI
jgi:predicted GNAT family N-acyltransferase